MTTLSFEEFIAADELPSLVQKNVERYRTKWQAMYAKAGSIEKMSAARSWNWAAFFLSGLWLFYRKMYVAGICWIAIVILLGALLGDEHYKAAGTALNIGLAYYGNWLYFHHTYKKLNVLREVGGSASGRSGGVSWISPIGAAVVVVIGLGVPMYRAGLLGGSETASSPASSADTTAVPVPQKADAPQAVPPAPQAKSEAAVFEPAGKYDYREKGSSGGLELIAKPDGNYALSIGTADTQSFHECSIGEDATKPILVQAQRLTDKTGALFKWRSADEPNCSVEVEVVPGSANVSTGDTNCSSYCGAGEDFTGVYVAQPK